MIANPQIDSLILFSYYIPFFLLILVSWLAFFITKASPYNRFRKLLIGRGFTKEQARIESRKDIEEILKLIPLDEIDDTKRKENFQFQRLLINDREISQKANLFRESGYKLKENDQEMINKIELQYNKKTENEISEGSK